MEEIIDAALAGIKQSQEQYEEWSHGDWLWNAPEYLITVNVANKIAEIDDHIIASTAGIISDGRVLIDKARLIAQQHRVTYDSEIDVETVIKELSDIKQAFTQYGGARPFGVSVILAGISGEKPKLYVSDVTGNYFSYKASALGENDEKIKEMLREEFDEKMEIEDALKLGLKIFKKGVSMW